ncbi:MAG: DUF4389 domain-containing protein [Gaiellaceae bacterium]
MSPGRIALIVLGSLVSLVAFASLAGGAGLLWLHEAKRDSDGFYTSKLVGLETSTHLLASEGLDVLDVPSAIFDSGRLGEARLAVTARDGTTPMFIGVAREADAAAYLADVDRELVTDVDLDNDLDQVRVLYDRESGESEPAAPGIQDFWFASVEGSGTQILEWDVIEGSWTVVVMNADASRGVAAEATVGARVGFVLPLAIGLVVAGAVLLLAGGGMIYAGGRRPDEAESALPVQAGAGEDAAGVGWGALEGDAAAAEPAVAAYPVSVDGELRAEPSRWLWLVKWLLLIPHYVVLFFLWIGFLAMTIVAFFAILFTARYPRGIFDFNVGVLRWTWRVAYYGYSALATDEYPPFTLEANEYPATFDVEYPERLSRGLVLVKWWLLAIPHYLIVAIFVGGWGFPWVRWWIPFGGGGLVGLVTLIAGVVLLFTGKYPRDLHEFLVGLNRWSLRVAAYAGLMRDEYPPFRLKP